jgi:hypothetical protein
VSVRLIRPKENFMYHRIVLASLLGALPACLNPDISDEYPLTMRAEALDVADGSVERDESADDDDALEDDAVEDDAPEDDAPEDDAEPTGDRRPRPRRFTRGAGPASDPE